MSRSKYWIDLEVGLSGPLSKTVLKAMAGLFERSSRDQLDWLMETLELRAYRPGAVLCSEGETAQELYVICSGRCGVYTQDSDGRLRLIDSVDQVGMLLGEQVFRQDRGFRSATILTLSDCEIGAVSGERFRELLLKDPSANETLGVWAARNARNKLVALTRTYSGTVPEFMATCESEYRALPSLKNVTTSVHHDVQSGLPNRAQSKII